MFYNICKMWYIYIYNNIIDLKVELSNLIFPKKIVLWTWGLWLFLVETEELLMFVILLPKCDNTQGTSNSQHWMALKKQSEVCEQSVTDGWGGFAFIDKVTAPGGPVLAPPPSVSLTRGMTLSQWGMGSSLFVSVLSRQHLSSLDSIQTQSWYGSLSCSVFCC